MNKKKENQEPELKDLIFIKAIDLGFVKSMDSAFMLEYSLPFGLSEYLSISFKYNGHITLDIENSEYILEIRKIESPEDLELLFNAICPEKYRLPFN